MKNASIFILFFVSVYTAWGQTPERLTDKDIKALIETIEQGRDRFENSLEDKMKNAWYRSPNGEVKIALLLDDFEKSVETMKERFTKDYSASSEAANMLQQASRIDGFIKEHPGAKGASEWDHLSVDLRTFANAYNTQFPLPDGGNVRRINDIEAAMAADSLIRRANQFKKEISRDKTLPKDIKEVYKRDVEELIKQAVNLRARSSDSKPATTEAKAVIDLAAQIEQSLQQDQMSSSIASAWNTMQASLQKLRTAFGMTVRPSS